MRDFYLKEQKNLEKQIRHQKEMVVKLRKYKKIKQSQSREKALKKFEEKAREVMMHLKSSENLDRTTEPKLKFQPVKHLSHEVMHCENLCKSFGDKVLFENMDLTIYGGEKVAIIGPNGCGKTTLINMMLGKDQKYTGDMNFGKWVDYAYLGQEVTFDDEDHSILQHMMNEGIDEVEARKRLSHFQFYGDVLNTQIRDLSGGEKVRLTLAMILLKAPHCLILDEPTNHLDLESRIAIENALHHYRGTVIAISHDRYFLNACVEKIIAVEDQNVTIYQGLYDDFKIEHMSKPKSKKAIEKQLKMLETQINEIESKPASRMTDRDYEIYDHLIEAVERLNA